METRIFKWKLEYSSGNSNIKWKLEYQVETRISSVFKKKGDFHGMYFPEGLIEYQVESRIFKWKLEYQVETRISSVLKKKWRFSWNVLP